jgi:hypothetical protein
VDDDHRVGLPRLASLQVSNAAPEVDDFVSFVINAACAAEFMEMPHRSTANIA